MSRPVSLLRILVVLVLLLAPGCRSDGEAGDAGAGGAEGAGAEAGGGRPPGAVAPGGDAAPTESGWLWTVPPPSWTGMPAADHRDIAFTYGHHALVLLDAEGRTRWTADRLGLRDVAPALTDDLVVAATDDGVAAFRRSDGAKLWDTALGQRANAPVVAGRLAVTSTWEGSLVALDLARGGETWKIGLPGSAVGPPATDGTVVVVTWDRTGERTGGAVAVEAATGQQRWTAGLPGGGISAPTLTPDGAAVVVAGDLSARALAVSSGHQRWRTLLDGAGSPEVPPAVAGPSAVLVAHRLGGVDLLDGATGRRMWGLATGGIAVRGGPVVGTDGRFAVPLDDGRMVVGGPGREAEFRKAPSRISGLAAGPGGLLVAASRGAAVNSVEATSHW